MNVSKRLEEDVREAEHGAREEERPPAVDRDPEKAQSATISARTLIPHCTSDGDDPGQRASLIRP